MAYPTTKPTKVYYDSSSDNPSQARAEFTVMCDIVGQMIDNAVSTNTVNTVVKRDINGDFAARYITAIRLIGNADTATIASSCAAASTVTGSFGTQQLNNVKGGQGALAAVTTGVNNVAVGAGALALCLTADACTAIGNLAAAELTSATGVTAVGYKALSKVTSTTYGSSCTAVGYFAGQLVRGQYNTIVGSQSLQAAVSTAFNTVIGANSLVNYTGSGGNTVLGAGQGGSLTTGISNVFIGVDGAANNKLTTGSENVIIGTSSGTSSSALANTIALGSSAIVNASNKCRIGNSSMTVYETQVAWTTPSDRRLKKDITELSSDEARYVLRLRPVRYRTKTGNDKWNDGLIAQETEAVVGSDHNVITAPEDPEGMLGIRYTDLIAPMLKLLQDQQKTIEQLGQQVNELRASLDARLATLKTIHTEV